MGVTYQLACHSDTPTRAVRGVAVTVQREAGNRIGLSYALEGNRGITLPRNEPHPGRRDGLWQDTCFEAFVMAGDGPGYVEYNFTTRRDWAAYAFTDYRAGRQDLHAAEPIFDHHNGSGDLAVLVDLTGIGLLHTDAPLHLGLSAVLKDNRGRISYWALAHPPGKPDFHARACFALTLGAPSDT